jgi:uncharacterized membrane protein YgcG
VITGVGGGVLRDLLTAEVPVVLHHRQLYAIPSLLGALVTVLLWRVGALSTPTAVVAVLVVFVLRVVALRFRLEAPGPWVGGRRPRNPGVGGAGRSRGVRRTWRGGTGRGGRSGGDEQTGPADG